MKGHLLWLLIAIGVILLVVPIAYSITRIGDLQFLGNFMGNWAATMIGAIIGIPIALAISRWQQKEQEKKESEEQNKERLAHKTKILDLLKIELLHNLNELADAIKQSETEGIAPYRVRVPGCNSAMWQALCDSGELQRLDDFLLVFTLAHTYFLIRALIKLDDNLTLVLSSHSHRTPQELTNLSALNDLVRSREMMRLEALDWVKKSHKEVKRVEAQIASSKVG